jgi:parvulin-like peptidyl-prolyl isomerase
MLKKLRRKKTAKWVWVILAILIVPAFVLWGSGSLIRSRQETTYAGQIFGRKIGFQEYKEALNAVKNQLIMQFGDNLSEIQKYFNLEAQSWERLILLYEAEKRRIKVSDKEVIETIENYPFLKDKKGQFDNRIYAEMLRYVFRTQPRIFEEQTRQNLTLKKLFEETTKNIKIDDQEVKEQYRKLNEDISLYYIASLYSDFAKSLTPSEEDLKDYFAKNSLEFKQPLSFNLQYFALALDEKDKNSSEDKIKKIIPRLRKKEEFAKVAKEFGLEVKETGLFNQGESIPGISDSPQVLNLILKLKVGEFSPPISMDKYYYILRLKERKEPYIPDFQTVKDRVKEKFIQDKSKIIAKEKIEGCLKVLKEAYQINPKAVDFNKAAQEFSLKSDSTALFKYGNYLDGIGGSAKLWDAGQKLKEDEFSEIIDISGGFYIIKLKSRTPIDEQKFAKEKAEFSQRVLLQKKQDYFENFFGELKIKAQLF